LFSEPPRAARRSFHASDIRYYRTLFSGSERWCVRLNAAEADSPAERRSATSAGQGVRPPERKRDA
jgi:hypothetical protein